MLPVAVTRFFSDGNAIRYVLPVLWMTSCFYIMERMGQKNQRRRVCFVQFARWRQQGAKSVVSAFTLLTEKLLIHSLLQVTFDMSAF